MSKFLFFILSAFLFLPLATHAAVYSQTVSTARSATNQTSTGAHMIYYLGSGANYSGRMNSFSWYAEGQWGAFQGFNFRLYECTGYDSGCSPKYSHTQDGNGDLQAWGQIQPVQYDSTKVLYTFSTSSPYVDFDPFMYYQVMINDSGGAPTELYFYGSAASTTNTTGGGNGIWSKIPNVLDANVKEFHFIMTTGSSQIPEISEESTRFVSLTPAADSINATSSTFSIGAEGYMAPEDWQEGARLKIKYSQTTGAGLSGTAIISWDIAEGEIETALAPGVFDFSEQVEILNAGVYTAIGVIDKPRFSVFGFAIPFFKDELARVAWQFTAATSTQEDRRNAALILDFAGLDSQTVASTTQSSSYCNVNLAFDLSSCLYVLIVPSNQQIKEVWDEFYNKVLVKFPLGYLTRLSALFMGSPEAVKPPALISYSFGSSSPQVLQDATNGDPIYFQLFDHMDTIGTIRSDDGQNSSVWDVVDPIFKVLVSFAVFGVIVSDLLGFSFASAGGDGGAEKRSAARESQRRQAMFESTISTNINRKKRDGGVR